MRVLIKNRQRHRPVNKSRITKTARRILSLINKTEAELSILFVGDKKMTELNSAYRGKNRSTDVLSFEASIPFMDSGADNVLGDIVISIPKADSQAVGMKKMMEMLREAFPHIKLGYFNQPIR